MLAVTGSNESMLSANLVTESNDTYMTSLMVIQPNPFKPWPHLLLLPVRACGDRPTPHPFRPHPQSDGDCCRYRLQLWGQI